MINLWCLNGKRTNWHAMLAKWSQMFIAYHIFGCFFLFALSVSIGKCFLFDWLCRGWFRCLVRWRFGLYRSNFNVTAHIIRFIVHNSPFSKLFEKCDNACLNATTCNMIHQCNAMQFNAFQFVQTNTPQTPLTTTVENTLTLLYYLINKLWFLKWQ